MKIWLYVKVNLSTGLKYFGKTTKDPYKYKGSGKYWLRHLKNHPSEVHTEIVGCFDNEADCERYAILFSEVHDIVKSEGWANLRVENGKDGAPVGTTGHSFTEEQRRNLSKISSERWKDEDYRQLILDSQKASWTARRKEYYSEVVAPSLWTSERRACHQQRMKELAGSNPEFVAKFKEWAKSSERTAAHCSKISEALTGVAKSKAHRASISWARLLKSNPNLVFSSYEEFVAYCLNEKSNNSLNSIAKKLGVSYTAISTAVRFSQEG